MWRTCVWQETESVCGKRQRVCVAREIIPYDLLHTCGGHVCGKSHMSFGTTCVQQVMRSDMCVAVWGTCVWPNDTRVASHTCHVGDVCVAIDKCVCIYIYIYIYMYVYVCIYMYVYVCVCVCMYVCVYHWPLIIANGTIFYSILCCNSSTLHTRLKYMYSVISVKLD